jgi:hypothetical protein
MCCVDWGLISHYLVFLHRNSEVHKLICASTHRGCGAHLSLSFDYLLHPHETSHPVQKPLSLKEIMRMTLLYVK